MCPLVNRHVHEVCSRERYMFMTIPLFCLPCVFHPWLFSHLPIWLIFLLLLLVMLVEIQLQQQQRVLNPVITWNRRLTCNKQWLFNLFSKHWPFHLLFSYSICLVVFLLPISYFCVSENKRRIAYRELTGNLLLNSNTRIEYLDISFLLFYLVE